MHMPIPHNVSAARVAGAAFAVVLLAVEAVITAESWRGLTGFAALIGIHGPASYGVPITLDGVSLVAALIALRAELAGEASGLYRATLFTFTGASAAANYWHGIRVGGAESALYLGGMSLAVAWVFALVLRQLRREDRRRAGRVTDRLPRFSAAHWARYPRLTWDAWSLAVRDGHASARAALDAATVARAEAIDELPPIPTDAELAAMPKADAIRLALTHNGGRVIGALDWLAERGVSCDRAYAHDVKRGVSGRRRRVRALTSQAEAADREQVAA